MRRRQAGRTRWLVVAAAVWLTAAAQAAGGAAKPPPKAAMNDAWLARVFLAKLDEAGKAGRFEDLAAEVTEAILVRVCCEQHVKKPEALNDMVYVLRACKCLPEAQKAAGKELAEFLLENRAVARRFFRALVFSPRPEYAYAWLSELVAAEPKRVKAYPDLSVAFATAHPYSHYRAGPKAASRLESFRWYANPKRSFRYDLRKVPYELSQYLADTQISIPERKWAYDKHRRDLNPAKSFFRIKYDDDSYKRGLPKKIDRFAYTLPNLRKAGGVCIDQAYYSVQVCKALGIPSTIVTGEGTSGMHHAWNACLRIARGGKRAYWDCTTGRYKAHRYYSGNSWYPLIGGGIHDSELMLIGMAAQLPLSRREGAYSALVAAKLAEKAAESEKIADAGILKKLAVLYNTKLRAPGDPKRADPNNIQVVREFDTALVQDLIALSIAANLAYKPAWDYIIELRSREFLPAKDLDRFLSHLLQRTARLFPQYSYDIVMELIPTVREDSIRRAAFRKAGQAFGHRPDLRGRLLMTLGDDFLATGDKAKALKAYELAATRCVNLAAVVVPAAKKAEKLLMESKRPELTIAMYRRLYDKAKKVKAAQPQSSARYKLGYRLAQLLAMSGNKKAAADVMREITPAKSGA